MNLNKVKQYCLLVTLFLFFVFIGCREKGISPAGYVSWVEDPANGLRIIKDTGDYHFDLQFKPLPLIALKEQAGEQIDLPVFEKALGELQGLRYFDLRIGRKDGRNLTEALKKDEKDKTEISNYLAGDMQYDFILIAGNDTLPCLLFHTEASGGATPGKTFLLAFDTLYAHSNRNLMLIYYDRLLGCGDITLTVKQENLNAIPVFNPK